MNHYRISSNGSYKHCKYSENKDSIGSVYEPQIGTKYSPVTNEMDPKKINISFA